jgi:hypothetical protein
VTSYLEPIRTELQKLLSDYTEQVVNGAWPLIRRGKIPTAGLEYMSHFQVALLKFEPATEGQKILHAETLSAYNHLIQSRRMRLDAVGTGLPGVMWAVIVMITRTGTIRARVDSHYQLLRVVVNPFALYRLANLCADLCHQRGHRVSLARRIVDFLSHWYLYYQD